MKGYPATARRGLVEGFAFLLGIGALVLFQWQALVAGVTTFRHDHVYWGAPVYGFFAERDAGRLAQS
ncbi:MAG TPA: hypothetical protein VK878_08080 [Candidatus Deferrimicrobiaceae bacterium]|nr:hypothetical protein [Candidatus Deferrimicrobiaceae bacterium]